MPQAIAAAAAWVATGVAAGAAAIGVTSTVAASMAVYTAAQAVVSVALSVGLQVGLSALTSPKVGGVGMGGSQVDFQSNPDAGVPYAVGETGTAGVYVYNTVGEAKNRNLLFCTVLSAGGPIEAFTGFKADGEEVTFGGLQQAVGGTYANRMWLNNQVGATPSPAFGPPNTTDGGVLSEWTTAHKLSGLAAGWYVLGYDQKTYAGGAPAPMWKLKGVRAYDPRFDSTYPGGSGDQRADDESTWAWSDNPWIHALTWCVGRHVDGKRVLGLGVDPAMIEVSAFVEAANIADANGWTVGGVVYSTDSKWEVLKAFCQAGGGRPISLGAKISCLVNAPRVSIATLTGADIEGDPTITATQSRRSRINAVVSRYRSEAHGWEVVPAAPLVVDAYVTEDRHRQRTKEIEHPLVQDATQATQLGAYAVANSREFGPVSLSVTPGKGWALKPGDCITVNEPETGMNGQKLLVCERERNLTTGGRILTCMSETDAKHDYCLGRTGTPPPTPGLTGIDPVPVAPASDEWVVAAGAVDEHGSPTLVLTGTCEDPNARWINVEYRLDGDTDWTAWPGGPPNSTRFEITGLKPSTAYDVAVSYTSVLNLIGERRILDATTTGVLPTPEPPGPDSDPPGEPSALTILSSLGSLFLSWTNPADADLARVEVWESATNDRADADLVGDVAAYPSGMSSWSRSGLDANTTRYYWLRAVDTSANVSGWYPAGATAGIAGTTDRLGFDDFPPGLEPVKPVTALPNPVGYVGPQVVLLSTDGKLYRLVGGVWTAVVPATDITGQLADSQIAALAASKVTGQLTNSQLADIAAAKITGQLSDSQIADIAAAKLTGQIVGVQIADGAVVAAKIDAGAVTTNKLAANAVTANEIAANAVTAAKINAGAVTAGKIAADAVTANEIAANAVTATELQAGAVTAGKIAAGAVSTLELNAGAVTTAKLAAGAVTANEISAGSITGDRLVTGTISTAYIAADAIDTSRLSAGAVTAAKIPSGTITADRLVVNEIDTAYIKNGALSNAGSLDLTGDVLIGSFPYTVVSGSGVNVEVRNSGGSYTTIVAMVYLAVDNRDSVNQVGCWPAILWSGAVSSFETMAGVLVEAGNPATICVPFQLRTNASGTVNINLGCWANLTGGSSMLYRTQCKIVPLAVFKS